MVLVLIREAIEPIYATVHPNDPIILFNELDLELRTPRLIFGKGNIEFRWQPIKTVRFDFFITAAARTRTDLINFFKLDDLVGQNAILNIPDYPPISLDVIINRNQSNLNTGELPTCCLSGLSFKTRFDKDALCDELMFHIVNLHDYHGTWIKYLSGARAARRIALSDDNWEIIIDGVENLKELLEELNQQGGFAITHAGVLRRRDKKPFKASEAIEQMKQLGFFLTFVEGKLCFPILLVGTLNGVIIFRDFFTEGRIYPWGGYSKWSTSDAHDLDQAYKDFVCRWNDPDPYWRETIALVLEFYARANTYPTVDFSVLDSFTALDYLALARGIKGWGHERIRLILANGELDTQHPPNDLYIFYDTFYKKYGHLKKCKPKKADIATILADFRNGVVHGNSPPSDQCRPNLNEDGKNPTVPFEIKSEAKRLGLWCVEMSLLYLIGYNGYCDNRLNRDQDVTVPWATPLALSSLLSMYNL
jgi:hypothetical protein